MMKALRNPTKSEIVVDMFPEVGDELSLEQVLTRSGISTYNSLKALLTYIRKAPVNAIDVRLRDGKCVRVA
jgi:hypothetical protein